MKVKCPSPNCDKNVEVETFGSGKKSRLRIKHHLNNDREDCHYGGIVVAPDYFKTAKES